MRTTVNIDEHLLREIREISARTNRSLSEIVEEGVRTYLAQTRRRASTTRVRLPTFGEGGLQPGVDLDDSADLLQVMEESSGPV